MEPTEVVASPSQMAAILNGREYGNEVTGFDEDVAKHNGLVIAFGSSDDLLEFRGTVYDEIGAYDGGSVRIDSMGMVENRCECDDCPYFDRERGKLVTAKWCPDDYEGNPSWVVGIEGVEAAVFRIMEDGELFGVGIVFRLEDCKND